jgi:hypothetical protein
VVNDVPAHLSALALDQRSEIEGRIKEMNAQIQSKAKETLARNNQKQLFFSDSPQFA